MGLPPGQGAALLPMWARRWPFHRVRARCSNRRRAPAAGCGPMRIGMTLPVMEPDLDADLLEAWCRAVDDGPFSSLCFGERMAFDNPEILTLLGAVAAWTSRVQVVTTVVVPQLHDPGMLAKALATADVLTKGRLTVGLGVGGRSEDYAAVGVDLGSQTIRGLEERALTMKR